MYYLAPQTFACAVEDQVVFLDLRRDRYFCLEPEQSVVARAFLGDTGGAPRGLSAPASESTATVDAGDVGRMLLDAGLITTSPDGAHAFTPDTNPHLTADLMGFDLDREPAVSMAHVVRLLVAASLTAWRLRTWTLLRTVERIRRRRAAGTLRQRRDAGPSAGAVEQLVEVFKRLRPLLFSAHNQCLYDSLVMLEFLSRYGVWPTCVIGVKMGPFGAHSWVEQDGVVYNDSVSYVARFTPIMLV